MPGKRKGSYTGEEEEEEEGVEMGGGGAILERKTIAAEPEEVERDALLRDTPVSVSKKTKASGFFCYKGWFGDLTLR
jgi:hypothetical protein